MGIGNTIKRAVRAIKECEDCARRRAMAKKARDAAMAHAARLAGLRKGGKDGKAQDIAEQAVTPSPEAGPAPSTRQAGDKSTAHGKRRVAKDSGAGTGKGRASVPGVRKAGRGETGSR